MVDAGSASPREIELKLGVSPADMERLRHDPLVESLAKGAPTTRTLHSVYFDTPDLRLAGAGVALRVRRSGDRFIQTLKTRGAGSAGLFERSELECELPGEDPDLLRISDERLRDWLLQEFAGAAPSPVIETRFERTSRRLAYRDAELLFELDEGEVHTPAGDAPICELELELVRGEAVSLYDLALEIQRSVAVRPLTISKADLGYARIAGEGPAPRKARPGRTPDDPSLDALVAAVLGTGIDHLVANEHPARSGVDPEGVHQLRVAARRLRAALSLFAPSLAREPVAALAGELRWLGGELGPARDLDVFSAEALEPLRALPSTRVDLQGLTDQTRALRAEAQERVAAALDSDRFPRLLLTLGRFLVGRGWRDGLPPEALARLDAPASEAIPDLLGRWHRKVAARMRRVSDLDTGRRHCLRIRAKKLRYAAEFLQSVYPGRLGDARRYAKHLARLQDILGLQNDAATADRLLASMLARLGDEARVEDVHAAGFVAGSLHERRIREERALTRAAAAFSERARFWSGDAERTGAGASDR